jgi:SAM-dependent methyltransferase
MPALPLLSQHDYAYFDFIDGLRTLNYTVHVKQLICDYQRMAAERAEIGRKPTTMSDAAALIQAQPLYKWACGIQRSAQEMIWAAGRDSIAPHAEALETLLSEMPGDPVGRLELNPDLELPKWYKEHDIHLNPGGYWGDAFVGPVYQRAVTIYRGHWRHVPAGRSSGPGALKAFARTAPPNRTYRRILDLGCAFGGYTRVLREVYDSAEEVVGVDLSPAALKWAHLTAEDENLKITFTQQDTADLKIPDNSFDLVTAYLLLHEMPPEAVDATLRESFRVLRPGGHWMLLDIPRYEVLEPEIAFLEDFDTRGNGEPFWSAFLTRNLPRLLRNVGFVDVSEGALDYEEPDFWGLAALARTGEYRAYNRWATHAMKPS